MASRNGYPFSRAALAIRHYTGFVNRGDADRIGEKVKKRELHWWLYLVFGAMISIVVPLMVSARDTISNIIGIIILVIYGVVSWKFWVRPLITKMQEKM